MAGVVGYPQSIASNEEVSSVLVGTTALFVFTLLSLLLFVSASRWLRRRKSSAKPIATLSAYVLSSAAPPPAPQEPAAQVV